MKYKIIASADHHWGAMDADRQYEESKFILDYLSNNKVDMYVICGDYFDHRLLVNSKSALNAFKFIDEIKQLSISKGFKVVMFDGTESHDYDQLEIFRTFEDENFKIFRKTTLDETLPGLKCLYAPDENLATNRYLAEYQDILFENYDIMFFHGTFDNLMVNRTLDDDIPNVIFEYAFYRRHCNLMVGGHWHDGDNFEDMYYTRSPYRWRFAEDLPKGIVSIEYDTKKKTYKLDRIENTSTEVYFSFHVNTSLYNELNQYSSLNKRIEDKLNEGINHIRVKITITDDKELNKSCIDTILEKYQSNRKVKVDVENKYVKTQKSKKKKELNAIKEKYGYIFSDDYSLAMVIKQFIKDTQNIDLSEDELSAALEDLQL